MKFPDGFLWGTATAAHQVEGGNSNCDFWVLEHVKSTSFSEPSGAYFGIILARPAKPIPTTAITNTIKQRPSQSKGPQLERRL